MMEDRRITRLETGVRNLDAILDGGLPLGSMCVLAGPPGSGKTILTQQILFQAATPERPAVCFSTLSEPAAKSLAHLREFAYFDPGKVGTAVHFVDLGGLLREEGLGRSLALIVEQLKRVKPALIAIDSFKTFSDLAKSQEELRKFAYELTVQLSAWECTSFLLGEYGPADYLHVPLFSTVDGILLLSQREISGEQQRLLQVFKMRGTAHSRDPHPFEISSRGVEVFAPRVTLQRRPAVDAAAGDSVRIKIGIPALDTLLGEGIPRGSSVLVSGTTGAGKTSLLLEFLYQGARRGEKGILFSFDETRERLLASARGLGFDLDRQIQQGLAELVFIPQPEILVERHLLMMHEKVLAMGARRVAVDSVSAFLNKVKDPQIYREKIFQLATVIQNQGAVALFSVDVPYGADRISAMGVEETVVDGVLRLTSREEELERRRYIEVYKLRTSPHRPGRHPLEIGEGGLRIKPRKK